VFRGSDVFPKDRALLEYLGTTHLEMLNQGRELTFLIERRYEIT
jgi:hypothetical protein